MAKASRRASRSAASIMRLRATTLNPQLQTYCCAAPAEDGGSQHLAFALGIWHLFTDHVHLKRNGLKVFEERLGAGGVALRRKRRLGRDFAKVFGEVRWIEEKANPSVLLRNISE